MARKLSLFICVSRCAFVGYPVVAAGEESVGPFPRESWWCWSMPLFVLCFWISSLFCLIDWSIGAVYNPRNKRTLSFQVLCLVVSFLLPPLLSLDHWSRLCFHHSDAFVCRGHRGWLVVCNEPHCFGPLVFYVYSSFNKMPTWSFVGLSLDCYCQVGHVNTIPINNNSGRSVLTSILKIISDDSLWHSNG